ncbi:WXG100 family type VII secretion target [Actinokineospora enzanensis]|uniref:WXG100 family type VII secretion target n=1 Tax=Actinokineospora enzanensis TaxID=155975 RepID=UPI000374312B|nr:WXG100 family type VII secretion target [Actinokineospora enzanensis]
MIQADLAELETLSRKLGVCSGEVDDLKKTLGSLIGSTTWVGGAADRFRHAWESQFRIVLDKLAHALRDAATEVDHRKVALDHAGN